MYWIGWVVLWEPDRHQEHLWLAFHEYIPMQQFHGAKLPHIYLPLYQMIFHPPCIPNMLTCHCAWHGIFYGL